MIIWVRLNALLSNDFFRVVRALVVRDIGSYMLKWALTWRHRLALTFSLGYGNTVRGLCFPCVVCIYVLLEVLFALAHLFSYITQSYKPWSGDKLFYIVDTILC